MDVAGLFVQDIALVNVEKRAEAKMILNSSQNDLYQTFNAVGHYNHHKQSFDETDPDLSGLARTPK